LQSMDGVAHVVCYEELTLIATDVAWLVSGHKTDSAPSPGG
jgi:hypothetical protein